ncbi:S24 family peptidase [Shewanella algae]|uniref:S24 family peptidase n=1 Tax=Shewanella algae TaxID=38313 RepID=UPI0011840E95|nr:helix-turn-helix transcriptional regulator [Shewanella algae]TVL50425.1 hypothetical protein AYI99_08840 [Shewanella algae]
MDITDRIVQRAKAIGVKQVDIVKATGASKGTVSNWFKGSNSPNSDFIEPLARLLEVSESWLLTGKEKRKSESNEIEFIGGFDLWDDQTPLRDDEVKLPIYTDVELSAGVGSCLIMEADGRYIRFSKKTLRDNNVDKHAAACARISGNSMEPVLADGTTVGIDTSKKEIKDGRLYAINHAGMLRIKLLYNIPGGGIRIRSYNASEYPDENITDPAQLEQIEVIGFVFWWSTLNKW